MQSSILLLTMKVYLYPLEQNLRIIPHQFCSRYSPKMAIKTTLKNVGDNMEGETRVWSIPLYTLFRFKEYLYKEMGWE